MLCFFCSWSPLAALILETQAAAPDIKSPKGEVLLNLLLAILFWTQMDKFLSPLIHLMMIIRRKKLSQTCILKIRTKTHTKKTPVDNKYRWFTYFKQSPILFTLNILAVHCIPFALILGSAAVWYLKEEGTSDSINKNVISLEFKEQVPLRGSQKAMWQSWIPIKQRTTHVRVQCVGVTSTPHRHMHVQDGPWSLSVSQAPDHTPPTKPYQMRNEKRPSKWK